MVTRWLHGGYTVVTRWLHGCATMREGGRLERYRVVYRVATAGLRGGYTVGWSRAFTHLVAREAREEILERRGREPRLGKQHDAVQQGGSLGGPPDAVYGVEEDRAGQRAQLVQRLEEASLQQNR